MNQYQFRSFFLQAKSTNFEKPDAISSLGSNQLFEKVFVSFLLKFISRIALLFQSTFLDYDDKQSIGTVGDDYNQKINSLKTIWDISDHPRYISIGRSFSFIFSFICFSQCSIRTND